MTLAGDAVRIEKDLLGSREVVSDVPYGIHTLRGVENFPRLGARVCDVPEFAQALGVVKLAALRANVECGVIGPPVSDALEQACAEMAEGARDLRNALVVPIVQGGAGTSTNMNVNEVLANHALALLGHPAGAYEHCHPNDHVNRSQSTNDVYPTALRVALLLRHPAVMTNLKRLAGALREQAESYSKVRKLGRTQLQDAVSLTVREELEAWADIVLSASANLDQARAGLLAVNLGGTAIGTGLTTPDSYKERAVVHLGKITGLPLRSHARLVSATTDVTALLTYSAGLRCAALALAKVADDLRLLGSGPHTGMSEVSLPAVQPGSSMMPGKVNPVIPEFVNQLAFRVHGADTTIAMALSAGQLQLNAMLPVAAGELFQSQDAIGLAAATLCDRCIAGMTYREDRVEQFAARGLDALSRLALSAGHEAASGLGADELEPFVSDEDGAPV